MNMKHKWISSKGKYYKDLKSLMSKLNMKHSIDPIDTNDEINQSKSQAQRDVVLCQICKTNESKYKCPQCKIDYCSIDCYKKHNNDCTEEFYKASVISELKSTKVNEEDSIKFRRNLKDVYDQLNQSTPDDLNESNNEIEAKRIEHYETILEKLNLNTFNIETDMTPEDWKEFNAFVYSNEDKKQYGALYYPFWLREEIPSVYIADVNYYTSLLPNETNNLKELELNEYCTYYDDINKEGKGKSTEDENENDDDSDEEVDYDDGIEVKTITLNNIKEAIDYNIINKSLYLKYKEINELSLLTKTQPAKENIYQLLIIVYTTVYLFRLFNGEFYIENDIEVIDYMMTICPLLHDKTPFTCCSIQTATNYFISNIKQIETKYLKQTIGVVLTDTMSLLNSSKSFIFECLIRLYEIIHCFSKKTNKKNKPKLTAAKHKLLYIMSYFKSLNSNDYNECIHNAFEDFYSNPSILV